MNREILEAIFAGAIPGMFWGGALISFELWYLPWILGAILGAIGTVIVWKKAIPAKWILVGCIFLLVIAGVRTCYGVGLGSVVLMFTWGGVIRKRMMDDVLRELAARTGLTYEPGDFEPGRVVGTYRGHALTVDVVKEDTGWYDDPVRFYTRIMRSVEDYPRGRYENTTRRLLQGVGRNVEYLQSLLDKLSGPAEAVERAEGKRGIGE